jgi:hypothetical protein
MMSYVSKVLRLMNKLKNNIEISLLYFIQINVKIQEQKMLGILFNKRIKLLQIHKREKYI